MNSNSRIRNGERGSGRLRGVVKTSIAAGILAAAALVSTRANAQALSHGGLYPVHPWAPMPAASGVRQMAPLPAVPSPPLSTSAWTPIGPAPLSVTGSSDPNHNVSGRITGIAADPGNANVIYVAPAGGGVWKTSDGGATWSPLTDDQSTLSMGAIAVAPSNSSIVYAGTGEANNSADSNYGRGILTSTDAGATWTLRTAGGAFDRLTTSKIVVDPTDPNVAYAAMADFGNNGLFGANTGIWKTTDGGATWTNTTTAINSSLPWSDVAIDSNAHLTLYAAAGFLFGAATNGVYKSTDGGATWNLLANGPQGTGFGRIAIAVGTANSQVIYASASKPTNPNFGALIKLMRSDDGGATWTDLTGGTPNYLGGQGWYDTTVIVDPADSAIVYLGGQAGAKSVLRSTDSGATWSDLSTGGAPNNTSPHVDHHGVAFDANGKLLDGDDGGIYRLDDPTVPSWTDLNGNLETIQFTGIGLHPTDPNKAIGGSQDNGTEVFSGDTVWTETDGGDGGYAKFSPTNGSRAYHQIPNLSFGTNFFRRSDDGGFSWATKTSSISVDVNNQNFYAPFVVDPGNGDRVLYGTNRVWETTNGGDSWATISNVGSNGFNNGGNNVDAIGLAPSDANTVYAATGGTFATSSQIFVTTNHGGSWTEVDLGVGGRVNELDVDPSSASTAYAVVNTFNSPDGQVYETTNGGTSWANITGNLPAIPVWSLQIDAAGGRLFVGADDGVYATSDGGSTWARYKTALPNAQVVQIELNSSLGLLGAGTHGRGMWEIKLGACGDGHLDPGEQCDDGNTAGGDCCSATCQLENCSLATTEDSFLRISPKNTNEGANQILSLRNSGRHRPVIGFDLSGKNTSAVVDARLVLTIKRNAKGWDAGRPVEAHALLEPFTEGTGMLEGAVPPVRGTGPGVTWNCATDTNIANAVADCATLWNGGNFDPTPSDTVMYTNSTSGTVSFDVTADVKAGITEWLVKKADEQARGRVLYYSREGAAAKSDPTLAPHLELDY
jgi:cysteine-rich repeat protein